METVTEISSGKEDDLFVIKPKKVKLEKAENINFTIKTIPGDGYCIANCFPMFLERTPPKFSLYQGTNIRKIFTYTWVSVNIRVRENFSKPWKNISLTGAITTILSI